MKSSLLVKSSQITQLAAGLIVGSFEGIVVFFGSSFGIFIVFCVIFGRWMLVGFSIHPLWWRRGAFLCISVTLRQDCIPS
jgi:uncharacterized protein (DUF2062 family)